MGKLLNFRDSEIIALLRVVGVFIASFVYATAILFLFFAGTFQMALLAGAVSVLTIKPLHDILLT